MATYIPIPLKFEDAHHDIALSIVFTFLTCGIYNIFWNAHQMRILNTLLKSERFSFLHWALFTILTCGLYHVYYQYKMGLALIEVHRMYKPESHINPNLPIMSIFLTLFGFTIITDAVHQNEIHQLYNN